MRHGTYWVIADGQDVSKVYDGYGVNERHDEFIVPLKTIEADDKLDKTNTRFESVRWFEPKSTDG